MSVCVPATLRALLLLFTVSLLPGSDGRLTIVAHREQDVTLPCQTGSRAAIIAAEWSRPDQESHYVFFYRDDQADKTHQHPSFEDRVELADGRMKGGNLSLILRHVRRSDGGTYECRVKQETAARRKRAFISAEPISIVDLRVTESRRSPGHSGSGHHMAGHAGLLLCLSVLPVMLDLLFVLRLI
ncbi:CD276 antigen homolog [Seriola aureovittata]|uniref:CD276 antigen homolog n=1 Tax=Seriola aureovittata TaxID=2871759 RepID=UPI0024BE6D17|nr:CD276 antigen homolog [Seriola aureovittata]